MPPPPLCRQHLHLVPAGGERIRIIQKLNQFRNYRNGGHCGADPPRSENQEVGLISEFSECTGFAPHGKQFRKLCNCVDLGIFGICPPPTGNTLQVCIKAAICTLRHSVHRRWPLGGISPMLRKGASGPEIGFPGWINMGSKHWLSGRPLADRRVKGNG